MPIFSIDADIVEDLVQIYRGAVPQDISNQNRRLDEAATMAAMMALSEAVMADWARNILVSTAEGSALDALAEGQGLHRQDGETDEQLRPRLRIPPTANTASSIKTALQQIVDANGGGDVILVELPRDGIYLSRTTGKGISTLSRGRRMSGGTVRMVIALIPASANSLTSCTDAMRSKVSAGKAYLVQEYVSG